MTRDDLIEAARQLGLRTDVETLRAERDEARAAPLELPEANRVAELEASLEEEQTDNHGALQKKANVIGRLEAKLAPLDLAAPGNQAALAWLRDKLAKAVLA